MGFGCCGSQTFRAHSTGTFSFAGIRRPLLRRRPQFHLASSLVSKSGGQRYVYTFVVEDKEKAGKLAQSLPAEVQKKELWDAGN